MLINKDELIKLPINFMYILPDQTVLPIFQTNINNIINFFLFIIIYLICYILIDVILILYLFYLIEKYF
jgi:hypothetical protein